MKGQNRGKGRRFSEAFPPLLAGAILLLPVWAHLLTIHSLPCTHDNALHYLRLAALRDAFRHGWLFSRWIPNLALGYGYPFFNFREPLPYVSGALLYALGVPATLVLGGFYALSFGAALWGTYLLARDLFGPRSAWIAALGYGLGPYLLLDALRRGNLPESFALALLPWLLFTFRRLILDGGRRSFVASWGLLSALFLSHNITSLLFAPFLGGYVVVLAWLYRERRHWPWAFASVALALGVTAWFWFPALTEQHTVQLHLSRTTRNNDFHYNFLTWGEMLLTRPAPYDPHFLNPPMRIYLGVVQLALAAGGVIALVRHGNREQRALATLFAGLSGGYLWMSTATSVALWDALPLLAFVQFPWRLVGRALLPIALLGGASLSAGWPKRGARLVELGVITLLVLFSWPDTYPPKGVCPADPTPDLHDVYAFEQQGQIGVDPEGSYFPVTVVQRPHDTALAEAFMRGELPFRLDDDSLPPGAEVLAREIRPLRTTFTLDAPQDGRARWLGLDYPGWVVLRDGVPLPTTPESRTGLLTFPIAAGRHTYTVAFRETPPRRAADLVSLLSLAMALGLMFARPRRRLTVTPPRGTPWAVLYLAVGLTAGYFLVIPHVPSPIRRNRVTRTRLPEVHTRRDQPFSDGLSLLGSDVITAEVPSSLTVRMLWGTRATPTTEDVAVALLVGADGRRWSPAGADRPRGYEPPPPTTMWQPGDYAFDPQIITPWPGTPPGTYRIVVSLFDRHTLKPASVLGADGSPLAPELTLGVVPLPRPAAVPALAALGVPPTATLRTCGALGLWHVQMDRAVVAPGDTLSLRWVWEALDSPGKPLTVTVRLGDAVFRRAPAAPWWPTDRWQAGERWMGQPLIPVPGGLSGGDYRLTLTLPGCPPLAELPLRVIAPVRHWDVPASFTPLDVRFGDRIRLAGAVITPTEAAPGDAVTVALAWQSLAEMSRSYHVFVHLLSPDGRLVAQDDGIPAGWTRPTGGWAVGEVITETRTLALPADLPSGEYELRVGWYEPDGPRLPVDSGADAALLAKLDVK